jgi:glycosyltransferase involved in cell wall biosynthesis
MKICYFGHPAHQWSGSSRFFEEILEDLGTVTYLRPDLISVDHDVRWALENDFDLYVFFQFDFLAYAFVSAGKRVVIVPMVDGSASYGSEHWKMLRNASFISFSPTLHKFLKFQSKKSFAIQYWPEPKVYKSPNSNSVYYWPRGHHNFVSTKLVLNAMENYPDFKVKVRASENPQSVLDYSRLNSDRLQILEIVSKSEHINQILDSSIFVAPRPSEGIGHSFLEAMSFGRVVLAKNFPTMSDYIISGKTGVFFPKRLKPLPSGLDWESMGRAALVEVEQGHLKYLDNKPLLMQLLTKVEPSPVKFKIREVHRLIDLSCAIMRGGYFPSGKFRTLQNFSNAKAALHL